MRSESGWAMEFLQTVDDLFGGIVANPQAFPLTGGSVRRALLKRFPYGLFFAEEGSSVVILAAIHARRDPRKWPERS